MYFPIAEAGRPHICMGEQLIHCLSLSKSGLMFVCMLRRVPPSRSLCDPRWGDKGGGGVPQTQTTLSSVTATSPARDRRPLTIIWLTVGVLTDDVVPLLQRLLQGCLEFPWQQRGLVIHLWTSREARINIDKQQLFREEVSKTNNREPRGLRLRPDEDKNGLFPQIRFNVIKYKQNS